MPDLPDARELAARVLDDIADRAEFEGHLAVTDYGAAVHACMALDKVSEAAIWVQRLVDEHSEDIAEIARLAQNLGTIWAFKSTSESGKALLLPLEHILGLSVAREEKPPEIEVRTGAVAAERQQVPRLEAVFAHSPFVTSDWLQRALQRSSAVARINDANGQPVATGFLVRGIDLHPELSAGAVLLTAAYVISSEEVRLKLPFRSLRPDEARISFLAIDNGPEYRVAEVLWSSPLDKLDTTVLRLNETVAGAEPCPIAPHLPTPDGEKHVSHIIGHPGGRRLHVLAARQRAARSRRRADTLSYAHRALQVVAALFSTRNSG